MTPEQKHEFILIHALSCYGMSHRNLEFYTDRDSYNVWFEEAHTALKGIQYQDKLDCYTQIIAQFREKETKTVHRPSQLVDITDRLRKTA